MKNLNSSFMIVTVILISLSNHLLAQQDQGPQIQTNQDTQLEEEQHESSPGDSLAQEIIDYARELLLESTAYTTYNITSDEILKSSKNLRYQGGINRSYFLSDTVNDVAERVNFNNMERLEFLKYLLDTGFSPSHSYINMADYFVQDDLSDETFFPTVEDFTRLKDICRTRDWPCDSSPLSFTRLSLFLTLFPRGPRQENAYLGSAYIEILLDNLGYTLEDLTPHDLMVLEQFLRDLNYVPGWSSGYQPVQRQHIKYVTDDDFQTEVIEASRDNPVIVYFYASWCPPCRTMTPMMERLADEFEGDFTLAKIYLDGNPNSREILSTRAIPALVFYKDGESISEYIGLSGTMTTKHRIITQLELSKTRYLPNSLREMLF